MLSNARWFAGHSIGKHRDSDVNRIQRTPIVTLSFGEARAFRLRPRRGQGFIDAPVVHGGVILMPWATNLVVTHEVPALRGATGGGSR